MLKILKYCGILLIVAYFIFSFYRIITLNTNYKNLETTLEMEQIRADDYYGQIKELSFIIENIKPAIPKNTINETIQNFTELRHKEFEKDSIEYIELPPRAIDAKILYGYHNELQFHFNDEGKLNRVIYPKYKPKWRRIN